MACTLSPSSREKGRSWQRPACS
ncbi:Putative protein of unknown function [Podospora comata]|uniref:Uncharacterized protein n=1 Tax=Podospora comata TaxID=48703 RepID=A0ABY6RVU9_PODCO|nr:Putative protein of unknown function [Podospora comata]